MQAIVHLEPTIAPNREMDQMNTRTSAATFAQVVMGVLPWLWLGIVVGISVIETPIRFRTPPITRDGAAMLGVAIFHTLAYVELVLLVVAMAAVLVLRDRWLLVLCAVLGLVVAIEHTLIVPILAIRAQLLVQGAELEPSSVHGWATALEAAKMLVLVALGVRQIRSRQTR